MGWLRGMLHGIVAASLCCALSEANASTDLALPAPLSTIAHPTDVPIGNVDHPLDPATTTYHFPWAAPRHWAAGDLRGTGLNDIVYAPSYSNYFPSLPIQILVNLGNGNFEDQTAQLIDGPVPVTSLASNVFINDFDNDGRKDIFIVDQGLEDLSGAVGYRGASNILLLWGSDGKLHDRSSTLPDNGHAMNHVSSMGDVNGDGYLDIVLTHLGGPNLSSGVSFLISDGKGGFTKSTAGIPVALAYPAVQAANYERPGTAVVCDLDGDGRTELITVSYNTDYDNNRSVRVRQKQADGNYVEVAKIPIADAIKDIPYMATGTRGLGGHQISCGKLAGTGRTDLLVSWEGSGKSYVQIMRNDGNFQFTDITISALGTYNNMFASPSGHTYAVSRTTIEDFDGDGNADIIFFHWSVEGESFAATGPAFINLGDGQGHFRPYKFESSGRELTASQIKAALCDCSFSAMVFDAGGSANKDIVLITGVNHQTAGPRVRSSAVDIRTIYNTSAFATAGIRAGTIYSSAQATSQSFLRIYNTGKSSGTATFGLRDYATGQAIGQWTSPTVPPNAEHQYTIAAIEQALGITNKPQHYSVSVQTPLTGHFQHVLWRPADGTLTNLSTCATGTTADSTHISGVHSSLLGSGYPSSIVVTNTGAAAATATLAVYDARDGTKLGTYTTASIPIGGHIVLTMAAIETSMHLTPSSGMYHYALQMEGSFSGFLQHLMNNAQVGVVTDMTTTCNLSGTSSAAVSPVRAAVFSSAQPSAQSFLRLHNTGGTAGTATVAVRNYTTGQQIGTWTSPSIAPNSEQQFVIGTIEQALGTFAKPDYYSISIQSTMTGYFQHVLWRPSDGTLTNLSTCATGVTGPGSQISGVHSSLVGSGYPSTVVIQNTASVAATAALGIYDARSGTKLGTYTTSSIPAAGQMLLAASDIEAGINATPTGSLYHYVVKIEGSFTGYLQHIVNNTQVGVVTDMTTACALATG